jgi:hypothetical protein
MVEVSSRERDMDEDWGEKGLDYSGQNVGTALTRSF